MRPPTWPARSSTLRPRAPVEPAGVQTLKATFTPADAAKYATASASVSIDVQQTVTPSFALPARVGHLCRRAERHHPMDGRGRGRPHHHDQPRPTARTCSFTCRTLDRSDGITAAAAGCYCVGPGEPRNLLPGRLHLRLHDQRSGFRLRQYADRDCLRPRIYAHRPHVGHVYRRTERDHRLDGRGRHRQHHHRHLVLRHDHDWSDTTTDRDLPGHGGQNGLQVVHLEHDRDGHRNLLSVRA